MAKAIEPSGEPRKERLEELVRLEGKVAEAAEAAADAAAHAVEATKAAEAASVARAADKAKPGKAGRTAKDRSAAVPDASIPPEPTQPLQKPIHVLDVRLTDDELKQIEQLATKKDVPVPDLARSLLVRALNRSRKT